MRSGVCHPETLECTVEGLSPDTKYEVHLLASIPAAGDFFSFESDGTSTSTQYGKLIRIHFQSCLFIILESECVSFKVSVSRAALN